jgi:Transglycosylase SLT domain/SPOR domain
MRESDRAGPAGAGRMGLWLRPALALSVLGLLAACGGPQHAGKSGVARVNMQWNRPSSYDPPGPPADPWGPWVVEAARRFDVPERWIREVMRQESGGRVTATSQVGAMGLMQIMPGTYAEMAARYGLGDDPYHPYDNLMAGTAYLREMYDLYGTPAFLAAYNAGPRRLEDYLFNNRGLPSETRNYVARIGPRIAGHQPRRQVPVEIAQAADIPTNIPPGPRRLDRTMLAQLREQREAAQPGIQLAQLPAGPVVRMEPIPDGSTPEGAARLAEEGRGYAPPPAPPVQLAANGPVVSMAPIPDGSTPEGAARLAEAEARPARAERSAPPAPGGGSVVAPLPLPPAQFALLTAPARAAERPAAPARPASLGFIAGAHAATLPSRPVLIAPAAASGSWAVQVGAFSSATQAHTAATQAKTSLASGQVAVQSLRQRGTTLYRARLTGLSQATAHAACTKLKPHTACTIISPGT